MSAPATYRLGSDAMIFTPGIVAYAMAGYRQGERAASVKLIADGWNISETAATALVSGASPYSIDGETVVFDAEG